jgi:hypothetical protein
MQTRLYSDLYGLIQALCGIQFSIAESIRVKSLINRRAAKVFRTSNYWTRFLVVGEERYCTPAPVAVTTTVAGNGYFIAAIGNTNFTLIGASSNTVGTYFVATGAGTGSGTVRLANSTIPYTETGKPSIDTFLRIFMDRPYRKASVQEYEYYVTSDGAELISGDLNPLTAFATYKKQLTDFYGDNTGEVADIPAEWFHYLAHGTYADWLKSEGQQDKASLADQEAEAVIQDELMRLDEQHTQTIVSQRIMTNANMQLRR